MFKNNSVTHKDNDDRMQASDGDNLHAVIIMRLCADAAIP
jgi:hypothetical protein